MGISMHNPWGIPEPHSNIPTMPPLHHTTVVNINDIGHHPAVRELAKHLAHAHFRPNVKLDPTQIIDDRHPPRIAVNTPWWYHPPFP